MVAPSSASSSLFLIFLLTLVISIHHINAQAAPAPSPAGPLHIIDILQKDNNYNTFIRLLNDTQTFNQIDGQVNNSRDGMTVFAPTDNAFQNLPSGTLNNLSMQQQVRLVLYHICPKFYSMVDLLSVSNPVRTLASDQDGRVYGLNFTGQANQVNVSSGVVQVPIYNAVRKDPPLAIYQVDKVLLPFEFYQAAPPSASPPAPGNSPGTGNSTTAPANVNNHGSGAGRMGVGFGLVSVLWLLCMGFLA